MAFDFNERLQQQKTVAPTSSGTKFDFNARAQQAEEPVQEKKRGQYVKPVPNALGNAVGDIAKDFFKAAVVKPAIRTSQAIAGVGINAFGSDEQKKRFDTIQSRPVNVPFLGSTIKVEPMKKGGTVNAGPVSIPGREIQSQVGDAAKTASWVVGGGAAPSVVKNTIGGKFIQGAYTGFKAGGSGGLLYGAGEGMQDENATVESVAKESAITGAAGAAAGAVLGGVLPVVPSGYKGVKNMLTPGKSAGPLNSSIMKLTKPQAMKFKNIVGEEAGEWTAKRGITGNVDEISEQLGDRFIQSRNAVDDAFAQIKGTYRDVSLDSALNELVAREKRIAVPGLAGKDSARIAELAAKNKAVGLEMKEINEVKRLFERQKLGYLKENNSDAIDKLTTIDTRLREWQRSKATASNFTNLEELNKETQATKELLNALGKQYGIDNQTMLTLTDWIVLSSDPTGASVPAYLVKKFAGNQNVKAFLARLNLKNAPKIGGPASNFADPVLLPAPKSGVAPKVPGVPPVQSSTQNSIPINLPGKIVDEKGVPRGVDGPPFFNQGAIPETTTSKLTPQPTQEILKKSTSINSTTLPKKGKYDQYLTKNPKVLYHGTNAKDALSIQKNGFNNKLASKEFLENPNTTFASLTKEATGDHGAGTYGDSIVELKPKKDAKILGPEGWIATAGKSRSGKEAEEIYDMLQKNGYDGLIDPSGEVMILNPAKFDIKKSKVAVPKKTDDFRYHTTSEAALNKIIKDGQMKPANGQYGKGVYFAPTIEKTGGYGSSEGVMIRASKEKLKKYNYGEWDGEQGWTDDAVPTDIIEYSQDGGKTWTAIKSALPKKKK